ncbi:hypothetical protein ACNI3Q_02265 [Sphingomonas sp. FW199]|uniref:hypothetical protein n=1 Tax=Sphingomonas sp. FW199 TaxID=3400217 RepID=UPI003CFAC5BF
MTDSQKLWLIVALAALYIVVRIRLFRVRWARTKARLAEEQAMEAEQAMQAKQEHQP